MKKARRLTICMYTSLILCLFSVLSCSDSKTTAQTKVNLVISEQTFHLDHFSDTSWMVVAEGKVTNNGPLDVKNLVITGYCTNCDDKWIPDNWFNTSGEKTAEQVAKIHYLPVGVSETFKFPDVAILVGGGDETPIMPEQLEVVIQSYEPVADS